MITVECFKCKGEQGDEGLPGERGEPGPISTSLKFVKNFIVKLSPSSTSRRLRGTRCI